LIPPSTKDLMQLTDSKYAIVVAVAKRARKLSEEHKDEESYRLSSMVTQALDDIINKRVIIR